MALPSVSSAFSQRHQWFDPAGLAKFDEMAQRGELEVVYELEGQAFESLTALNSTDLEAEAAATERGAPLSAFSVPSAASVVLSPGSQKGVSDEPKTN